MDISRYKELEKEINQLIIDVKPFVGDFGNLLKPLPNFTQKELNKKIKRIKKIDKLLKRADEALCIYTRPIGNYKSSINNFD